MRRVLAGGAVLALIAGCGGGDAAEEDPFKAIEGGPPPKTHAAAPRWEHIATVSGPGTRTKRFTIVPRAIQWRARWRCASGALELSVDPPPRDGNPLARARCPRRGRSESIQTGTLGLRAEGTGRWLVKIEQQVDTPLRDRPLPGMTADRLVAKGPFYPIDKEAKGSAALYRLPNGRLALRFDRFETSQNIDLFVWLSKASKPRTTKAAFRAPHVVAAELKSTLGNQNYLLPAGTHPRDVRSVVIWCEPVRNAYTAAALRPVRGAGEN